MEIHKVICTKCGIEKDLIPKENRHYFQLPKNWKCTYFGLKNGHLCPECDKEYIKHQDKFVEE